MRHPSLIAALLLPWCIAACREASAPGEPGATVTASATPSSARIGDTVHVRITVTNIGSVTVQVIHSGCNNDFTLLHEHGTRYFPAEQVLCPLALVVPVVLAPGESTTIEQFTTGRVIAADNPGTAGPAPAGTYRVEASVIVILGDEDGVETHRIPGQLTFRAP